MQRAWHFIFAQCPGTDVTHALYRLTMRALAWFKTTLGSDASCTPAKFVLEFTKRLITADVSKRYDDLSGTLCLCALWVSTSILLCWMFSPFQGSLVFLPALP